MRPRVVVVADEAPVLIEKVRLNLVRFVERFNLAYGCGPAYAGSDVFNSQFLAVHGEFRCSSSGRLELRSLISKHLFGNTIPPNGFLKQVQGVFSGWTPYLNRASDES